MIRVVYIFVERRDLEFSGDAFFYHEGANLLADGKGFISPYAFQTGREVQAADHPPLYIVFLAIPSLLRMTSTLTHLLWSALLGTATVVVVGLVGRAVAGARAGIVAAFLAAVYPSMWAPDGALEAETLAMFTTALVLLFAYRFLRQPSWGWLAATGAAVGAAALSRSELILLVPLLLVPMALLAREIDWKQRWKWLGASALATLVVVAPWVGYNLTRFDRPVLLSSQFESLLASANCDTVYYGDFIGYFSIECATRVARREHVLRADESEQAAAFRSAAIDYAKGHLSRLPAVVGARVGRMVGLFEPEQQINLESLLGGREYGVAKWSMHGFYILALLSIVGAVVMRRRRTVPVYPLLAVLGTVLLTVIVTYANIRFRAPAEVVLAILGAVAIDAGIVPRFLYSGSREHRRVRPGVREPATSTTSRPAPRSSIASGRARGCR